MKDKARHSNVVCCCKGRGAELKTNIDKGTARIGETSWEIEDGVVVENECTEQQHRFRPLAHCALRVLLFVAAPCWVLLDARGDGEAALVQSSPVNAVGGVVSLIQSLRANLALETTELNAEEENSQEEGAEAHYGIS